MDFFKFNPTGEETFLEHGQIINNIERSMWIERYQSPGEFSLEAQLSTGIREFLPIGSIISHIDTLEVMIVDNHEIQETNQEDPKVITTGSSFPSFLENRIVGTSLARVDPLIAPYILPVNDSWHQIVALINDHITSTFDPDDEVSDITAVNSIIGSGTSIEREISRGTVLQEVQNLLKIDDIGFKTVRRNNFHGISTPNTNIVIYKGVDRSSSVMFSWKSGDLDSASYLFSQKNKKTSAMVVGQYVYVLIDNAGDKYDRRTMIVDATDIDGNYGSVPAGGDLFNISVAMGTRGLQALAKQKEITITQTDVSETTKYQYRKDYNMGDLVTLDGNFNQTAIMRVVEYAEVEDENGKTGHPTLAIPGG